MVQSTAAARRDQFTSVRDRLAQQQGLPFLTILSRPHGRGGLPRSSATSGGSASTPPGSPWASSSPRSSPTTSPATRPSIASRSSATTRDSPRSPPRRPATARPGPACPRGSSGTWSAGPGGRSMNEPMTPGSSTAGRSRSSTARPSSCPTRRGTRRRTPSRAARPPGWASRSRGSSWSSAWPWARCSRPRSAPTRASRPASWPCSGRSSTSSGPATSSLADRFFCSYWVIAALRRRGVDVVVRLHQRRTADFRRGRRLGRGDHLVTWTKPAQVPDWMSRAEYEAMPRGAGGPRVPGPGPDKTKRVRTAGDRRRR